MSIRPFERNTVTLSKLLHEMGKDFQREMYILDLKDKLKSGSLTPQERKETLKELQNIKDVSSNMFRNIIADIIAPAIDPRR